MKRPKYAIHEDPDYVKHLNRKEKRRAGITPKDRPEKAHPVMQKHITAMQDVQTNRQSNGGSYPTRKNPRSLHNNPEVNQRGRARIRRQPVYDKKKKRMKIITHNNR